MNITLSNGSFSYDCTNTVFSGLSFEVTGGEVMAILGPNGCGKTTLLKCVIGLLQFDGGHLLLDGNEATPDKNRSSRFGYVPQITSSPHSYTVFQMVLLGRSRFSGLFSGPSERDICAATAALARVGITRLKERTFSSLSGGERQMVLIARALATEAEVLVFDEPTSALDLVNQQHTVELMRSLSHDHEFTVIFTTHAPSHALHISDRTLMMSTAGGSLFGESQQTITEENIRTVFGIETRIFELHGDGGTSRGVLPVLKPFERKRGERREKSCASA